MSTESHCPVCSKLFRFVGPLSTHCRSSINTCPFSLLPGDSSSGASSDIGKIAQDRCEKQKSVNAESSSYGRATPIMMLSDNVLLEIFDLYRANYSHAFPFVWKWHLLAHVCQTWRQIIFASPQRLNLQIRFTPRTPVRDLGIWPALPIVMDYFSHPERGLSPNDEENVIAAFKHLDRMCGVRLQGKASQLAKTVKVMQESFPVLTRLEIISMDRNALVLPSGFLGGSAPSLKNFQLFGIHYPALPTLLLSTSDLVSLKLCHIPPAGYISPEAMVACLAALPRLKHFSIGFQLAISHLDRMRPPPVTRTVLPALTFFRFRGASEYLEDLVARIDGPRLVFINVKYLTRLVDSQVVQLSKFVHRSVGPQLNPFWPVHVGLYRGNTLGYVNFILYRRANYPGFNPHLDISLSCEATDLQVSHMTQVLSQFSAIFSTAVHLEFAARLELVAQLEEDLQLEGGDDVEWLHLLRQFTAVQTLHVGRALAGRVALTLEGIPGEMLAEVLPSLDLIFLAGQPASSVEKFVAACRLSDRPVTVVDTRMEFKERRKSYVNE